MHKRNGILAVASILIAGVAAGSALYAQDTGGSSHSMTGPHGMMGHGGMTGMANMMPRASRMTGHCGSMMQGGNRPNDQWRRQDPSAPEKKG
jgi:hypothetical protein